ncbi:hypothetical protein [Mangrovibacter phragmitis]|uniref:hypothetical protein n=1 Tax=Mangrovibacter phragmitis TaxID=1691903 RepID=UPI00336ACACA
MNTHNVNTAAQEPSERWGRKTTLRTDGFIRNIPSRNPVTGITSLVVLDNESRQD